MGRIETVTIVHKTPKVLLGMKKNKFGKGKYNGFGGGLENGESLEECAIRETKEEAGITILDPVKMGRLLFCFDSDEQNHLVYFFRATKFDGELRKETNEMISEWFNEKDIPYNEMWEDDQYWLPLFLDGKKFYGDFWFNSDYKIRDYKLNETSKGIL